MRRLSHVGADGRARMVDVSKKPLSARTAVAAGKIRLHKNTVDLIKKNEIAKGDVIATARLGGIQAAKQTAHLIPLCHTIPLSEVKIDIVMSQRGAEVTCTARTVAQTGVEMEALTGVSVALLTIYDMCKAVDKEMQISSIRLVNKTKSAVGGGRSISTLNKSAQKLGRLAAGKPKNFSAAELARRKKRLAEARKKRWPRTGEAF